MTINTLVNQARANFVDVRAPNNRLVFRIDPATLLVEWRERGERHYIPLAEVLLQAREAKGKRPAE